MSRAESDFSEAERRGLYRAIFERRDVRSEFLPDPIPGDVLARLLRAAHRAPSAGFMQPWDFVLVESREVRERVKASFDEENARAAENYEGERKELYEDLKLEGILESPLNLCVTCNRTRGGEHVLGRNSIVEMDLFSTCLAVQNLWLAARVEGVGVGWVSIVDEDRLGEVLGLPDSVYPLAYLCLGYVSEFRDEPELAEKGWRQRLALADLVHRDAYDAPLEPGPLRDLLEAGDAEDESEVPAP